MPKPSLRILHLADCHLDRPLYGGKLKLPIAKAEIRQRELRDVFADSIRLAKEEQVDIILIAGDLWDEDHLSADTVPFVLDQLSSVKIPVLISPGNCDCYSALSHYSDSVTNIQFERRFPANVHIFRESKFANVAIPGFDGIIITGLAYRKDQEQKERIFQQRIHPPESRIKIALFHGSRENLLTEKKAPVAVFTDQELRYQPFDYCALGHIHSFSVINDNKGMIKAAYPGSTCALNIDDVDERGVIVCDIHTGGVDQEEFKLVNLDPRRIFSIRHDITGLQNQQSIENSIIDKLSKSGVGKNDIVSLELEGSLSFYEGLFLRESSLKDACFYLHADVSKLRYGGRYMEDVLTEPKTAEKLFRKQLLEMIDEAVARGDIAEVDRLQHALNYGLDALQGLPIKPR